VIGADGVVFGFPPIVLPLVMERLEAWDAGKAVGTERVPP